MKRYLKIGAFALGMIAIGFLLGTGSIGNLINIGESTIASGSTAADTGEFRTDTDQIAASGEREIVEGQTALNEVEGRRREQVARVLDPDRMRSYSPDLINPDTGQPFEWRMTIPTIERRARAAFEDYARPESDQEAMVREFMRHARRYAKDGIMSPQERNDFLMEEAVGEIFEREGIDDLGRLIAQQILDVDIPES